MCAFKMCSLFCKSIASSAEEFFILISNHKIKMLNQNDTCCDSWLYVNENMKSALPALIL